MPKSSNSISIITVVAPLPPPLAGPEVATRQLLRSPLKEDFEFITVNANVHKQNAEKGTFSLLAVWKQLGIYARLVRSRTAGSHAVYALLGTSTLGVIKDAGTIWLAKLLGMRVAIHIKGERLPVFFHGSSDRLRRLLSGTVRVVDIFIVQGSVIGDALLATFDIPPSRVVVIPNMVETSPRRRPPAGRTILFLGHLSPAKGFVDLVSVLKDLLPIYEDAEFLFAGDATKALNLGHFKGSPEFDAETIETIRRFVMGGFSRARYLGFVDGEEKDAVLDEADILVLPSYSESFPLALLEGMAHQCAIIGTTVGAVPDLIRHGVDGLLVTPGDREELAEALGRLLDDTELRQRLAESARIRVEEAYSIERVLPLYRSLFARLVRAA